MSKFNLKKNNIISNNNVLEVSPKKRKHIKKNFYNLIFANILLPQLKSLIKEFTYILDHNGLLIVSGILNYQKNYLINLFGALGQTRTGTPQAARIFVPL